MLDKYGIELDATKAVASANRFADGLGNVRKHYDDITKVSKTFTDQGKVATQTVDGLTKSGQQLTETFSRVNGAWVKTASVIGSVQQAMAGLNSATSQAAKNTQQVGQAVNVVNNYYRTYAGTAGQVANANQQVTQSNQSAIISWQSLARFFQARIIFDAVGQIKQSYIDGAKASIEFSKQIGLVRTLASDAGGSFDQWSDAIKNVSNQFGDPAIEVARAAYDALSNQIGDSAAEIQAFLTVTSNFSKITGASAEDASNLFSSAINSFGLSAMNATEISQQFFKTIDLGRIKANELANSFGRTAVPAAQLGVSMEELNASLAVLTALGNTSSDAQTQMLNLFNKLIKPSEALQKHLASIGFSSGQQAIQVLGFVGVLEELQKTVQKGGLGELAKELNDIRGFRAGLGLLENLDKVKSYTLQIGDAAQQTGRAIGEVFQTNGQKLTIEFNRIANYFLGIGDKINSVIVDISAKFGDNNNGLLNVVKQVTDAIIALGSAFGVYKVIQYGGALVSLVINLGGVAGAVTELSLLLLANPFGIAIAAVAALAGGLIYLSRQSDTAADRYAAMQEEIAKSNNVAIEGFRKVQVEQQRTYEKGLDASQKAQGKILASSNAVLEKQFDLLKDNFDEFKNRIGTAGSDAAEAFGSKINELNRTISENESAIKRSGKAIEDYKASIADDNFDEKIDKLSGGKRVAAIIAQARDDGKKAEGLTGEASEALFRKADQRIRQAEQLQKSTDNELKSLRDREATLQEDYNDPLTKKGSQSGEMRELLQVQRKISELEHDRTTIDFAKEKNNLLNEHIAGQKESMRLADIADAEAKEKIASLKKQKETVADDFANVIRLSTGDKKLFEGGATSASIQDNLNTAKDKLFSDIKSSDLDLSTQIQLIDRVSQRTDALTEVLKNRELITLQDRQMKEGQDFVAQVKKQTRELRDTLDKANIARQTNSGNIKGLGTSGFDTITKYVGSRVEESGINDQLKSFSESLQSTDLGSLDNLKNLIKESKQLTIMVARESVENPTSTNVDTVLKQLGTTRDMLALLETQIQAQASLTSALKDTQDAGTKGFGAITLTVEGLNASLLRTAVLMQSLSLIPGVPVTDGTGPVTNQRMGGPISYFANGGQAHGSDSINAMLQSGEFVMNAQSSRTFRSQLLNMNSGMYKPGSNSSTSNVTVGDVNVNLPSTGSSNQSAIAVAKAISREMKRGTVKL